MLLAFCTKYNVIGYWQVVTEFEEQWANGKVQGWETEGQENGHVPAEHTVIDLDYYSTIEELMEVGPEKLKEVMNLTVISLFSAAFCSLKFSFKQK